MSKQPPEHLSPEAKAQWEMAFGSMKKRKVPGQSPANALTQAVKDYIDSFPSCKAYRVNTMGVYSQALGKFIHGGSSLGIPDLVCILTTHSRSGLFCGIEIKISKDKQSDVQKKREAEIIRSGGKYFIAKDFDSTKTFIDNLLNE